MDQTPEQKNTYLFGALSGFMMVMSVALVVILAFAVTDLFFKATEFTGYFKRIIYHGASVPSKGVDIAAGLGNMFHIVYSMWKFFILFGAAGTACSFFKNIDNRKEGYFPLYVAHISRTFLYWFSLCFTLCAAYAVIKLRHIIYIDTIYNGENYYSLWTLTAVYLVISAVAGSALNQSWLLFYRMFTKEPKQEDIIDFKL